jgi:hypothetical protein
MALTTAERAILAAELTNDPLARGYIGMSNAQVVDSLRNTIDRPVVRKTMDATEVFQAINTDEFLALTDAQQRNVMAMLGFGRVNPAGKEATLFIRYFGAGSATITALQSARTVLVSRAYELNIHNVYEVDVAAVRGG